MNAATPSAPRGLTPRQKRFAWIAAGLAVLATAVGLVLYALSSNIVFFFTPTQVSRNEAPQGRAFRVGGLVEPGSLQRQGIDVRFKVTDNVQAIPVVYRGTLPDLFKEGKGVVAQGTIGADGIVTALTPGNITPVQVGTLQTATFVNPAGLHMLGHRTESVLGRLLPVLDTFEMAMQAAAQPNTNLESLKAGVSMIQGQLRNTVADYGVEEIDAMGKPFDPALHEALSQQETTEVAEGLVISQNRKGYRMKDRLLRAAAVVVARKPSSAAANTPSQS
jgi:cytochrome c-type biogenesis protein CcmE